jgi:hypothetical protein
MNKFAANRNIIAACLLDIARYIVTAVCIAAIFKDIADSSHTTYSQCWIGFSWYYFTQTEMINALFFLSMVFADVMLITLCLYLPWVAL